MNLVAAASVGCAVEGLYVYHPGFREDLGPALFSEVEIILVEGVLGAESAADHASAAAVTSGSLGAFAAKERIRMNPATRLALGRLENSDGGAVESVSHAEGRGRFCQQVIGWSEDVVLDHAKHAGGFVIMAGHFGFPVGEAGPRAHLPDLFRRAQQGAGVGDGSAAHGASVEDGDMAEEAHIKESAKGEIGTPEPAIERPIGVRKILRGPAAAHFDDGHAVAFFHQTKRRDATAESGANHDKVEIEFRAAIHREPLS